MGGFANPRYLCSECERDFEEATTEREIEKIAAAMDRIGEKLKHCDVDDKYVLSAIDEIRTSAKERAELIKCGEYDFSLEEFEPEEEPQEDEDEEEAMTEEELEAERILEQKQKVYDRVTNIICLVMMLAVVGFMVYKALDRFFF